MTVSPFLLKKYRLKGKIYFLSKMKNLQGKITWPLAAKIIIRQFCHAIHQGSLSGDGQGPAGQAPKYGWSTQW
jgi:hypothetical protein